MIIWSHTTINLGVYVCMCVCVCARTTGQSQWDKPEMALKLLGQDDFKLVNPQDRVEGGDAYAGAEYGYAEGAVAADGSAENYAYGDTGGE